MLILHDLYECFKVEVANVILNVMIVLKDAVTNFLKLDMFHFTDFIYTSLFTGYTIKQGYYYINLKLACFEYESVFF